MSPTKISYRIGGKEGPSVTAEDYTWAVLETPVGRAQAIVYRNRLNRFTPTLLPGDSQPITIFPDMPGLLDHIVHDVFKVKRDQNSRTESYQTVNGKVEIKVETW